MGGEALWTPPPPRPSASS